MKLQSLLFLIAFSSLTFLSCKNQVDEPPAPGPAWIVYTKATSPLLANQINYITLDSQGKIWFATDSGANSFSASGGSWGKFQDSLKSAIGSTKVTSIAEAKDRSIWFGLLGGGAVRYNQFSQTGHVWVRYSSNNLNELLSNVILGIATDRSGQTTNGEVWVATGAGISRFTQTGPDVGNWTSFTSSNVAQLTTNFITAAETNPIDSHIWFGLNLDGVVSAYYTSALTWDSYTLPQYDFPVQAIAFDRNNTVWIGKSQKGGAVSFSLTSNKWQYFIPDSTGGQFPLSDVHSITTDIDNPDDASHANVTRWFGTDSGLVRLKGSVYTRFTTANSQLPNNKVTAVRYDLKGNLWIGTANGAAVYNPAGTKF